MSDSAKLCYLKSKLNPCYSTKLVGQDLDLNAIVKLLCRVKADYATIDANKLKERKTRPATKTLRTSTSAASTSCTNTKVNKTDLSAKYCNLKTLTPKKRQAYIAEGKCLRCCELGHKLFDAICIFKKVEVAKITTTNAINSSLISVTTSTDNENSGNAGTTT